MALSLSIDGMEVDQFPLDKATLIKEDGTTVSLTPNGKKFTYQEIYQAIGNIIQPICLRYYTKDKVLSSMNFIVDEEGAIKPDCKLNQKASGLLKAILGPTAQNLYGPVIFLPNALFRI